LSLSDWISRYGGEEFLICLPGAGLKRAIEIAEYMRITVENNIILRGEHTNYTKNNHICK